jgi:hypothetical protein
MVVVYASGTVSRGGPTGNQIYNSTYNPWSTSTPQFGADYNGNGVFIPPGETPPNYSGGQTPYTDGQRPMPEKDAVMIIQHVKFHSGSFPPGAADPIQLDTSKIVAYGSSAGAAAMAWPVLGPDRAAQTFPNAAPGTQEVEDTRVPYAVLEGMPAYFGRFVQSDEILNSPMGIHFPVNPMSGGSPDYYDVPSRHLDQIANQSYQDAASPLVFGFDGQGGPIHTLNSQLKLYLGYSEASTAPMPICFGVDPDGNISSNCVFDRDVETAKHPSWSGHVWKLLYPTAHLVTTFQSAYTFGGVQPFTPTAPNRIPDKVLPNSSSVRDFASDEIDWLLGELNAIGTWTPLGGALAGVQGTPNLAGEGPLAEGTPTRVSLTNAAPNALSALVAGFSRVDEPFLGGVLIPDPQFLFFSQTTVSGRANTIATWPSVPAGTRIWFQQWTYDPSTFFGMSASNGLLAETP